MRTLLLLFLLIIQIGASAATQGRAEINLTPEQLFEFDQTGWITMTSDQRQKISAMAGFSPSRIKPIYHEPDGEVAELGYNMALRTSDGTVEVLQEYLMRDEQVKTKIGGNQKMIGAMSSSGESYPSYIIDAEGKYWKFISHKDFVEEIKGTRKSIGLVYVYMPTSLDSADTVASRDGLRRFKTALKKFNLPSYEITKK